MDKFEKRRLALKALVERHHDPKTGRGGASKVARALGTSESYFGRMLWETTRPGAKRIGDEFVERLDNTFPGWMEGGTGRRADQPQSVVSLFDRSDEGGVTSARVALETLRGVLRALPSRKRRAAGALLDLLADSPDDETVAAQIALLLAPNEPMSETMQTAKVAR